MYFFVDLLLPVTKRLAGLKSISTDHIVGQYHLVCRIHHEGGFFTLAGNFTIGTDHLIGQCRLVRRIHREGGFFTLAGSLNKPGVSLGAPCIATFADFVSETEAV